LRECVCTRAIEFEIVEAEKLARVASALFVRYINVHMRVHM